MTTVRWLRGEQVAARCPVCGGDAPKQSQLDLTDRGRTSTLVLCPDCGLRFFPGLQPALYAEWPDDEAARGFELAFGLMASIECLGRLDTARFERFLDVGCGTGFSLDFGRRACGWDVLGVDAGAWSRAAGDQLGLPVVDALLGETDDVPAGAWDLVFANEVIEHVVDPHAFLAAMREAAAGDGVVLLCTPAGERVTPDCDPSVLRTILSPGFHTMLHSRTSLERVLRTAGFTEVEVLVHGDSLHAAGATVPFAWDPDGAFAPDAVLQYLRERAAELPTDSAARLGLLQQLANQGVARGDGELTRQALEGLDATLRARHGAGLDVAPDALPAGAEELYCHALSAAGHLALAQGERERATAAFVTAADAGEAALAALESLGATALALEIAARRASVQAAVLQGDAARVERLVEGAGPTRGALALELLVRSVVAGSYDAAARAEPDARAALAAGAAAPAVAREATWALGMLALWGRGDAAAAADTFAPLAADAAAEPSLRWSARFHEGYARWQAGDRDRARPHLQAVADGAQAPEPPLPELVERARALLAEEPPPAPRARRRRGVLRTLLRR